MGYNDEKKVIRDGGITKSLTVGAVSGAVTMFIAYPPFSLKNRAQAGLPFTFNPMVLMRGSVSMAMSKGSIIALTFLANDSVRRHVYHVEKMTFRQSLISAAFAGAAVAPILSLQEYANIRQQMVPVDQRAKNVVDTMVRFTNEHGVSRGLVGMPAAMVRNSFIVTSFLALTPFFKREIKPAIKNDFSASIIAGILTGFCTSFIALPLDTIKTKQQKNAHSAISSDFSFFQITKNVFRGQGVRGMYAGAFWYFSGLSLYVTSLAYLNEKTSAIYDKYFLDKRAGDTNKPSRQFNFFGNKKPSNAEIPDNSKPKFRR